MASSAISGGVGRERQRHDELRVLGPSERRHHLARDVEALVQDADHFVRLAVQDERAAHGARIAAEAPDEGGVGQHRAASGSRHRVLRTDGPRA